MAVRIVGIVGSPREGNTELLVRACLEEAQKAGTSTELILLREMSLQMCDGCLECDETGRCHFEDGMNEINERLALADGLVIGTPARWRLLSGDLKVFLDRTNPLAVPEKLKGKKAAIIAVGQTTGADAVSIRRAAESVVDYCEENDMSIIGTVVVEGALEPRDVLSNEKALNDCRELGRALAQSLEALDSSL